MRERGREGMRGREGRGGNEREGELRERMREIGSEGMRENSCCYVCVTTSDE